MSPLSDLKVLDFSKFLPGPYCTWMLGDLGCDIVRLEHPRELAKQKKVWSLEDETPRQERLRKARDVFTRNKKNVLIDPGHEQSKAAITALIKWADIIVEDYRPGVMAKMGWGYETVRAINPRAVYCSVTLCGQTGPYRDRPGHDPIAMSVSGAMSRSGEDPDAPSFTGLPVADMMTGSNAVIGILAAIHARTLTGEGQHVDIAMSDASVSLIGTLVARNADLTKLPKRGYRRTDQGLWKCADGQWLCTTDMEPAYWAKFCEVIGHPEFIPLQMNPSHYHEITEATAKVMATKTRDEWVEILGAAGTQFMPVLEVSQAMEDPHNQAREMVPVYPTEDGDEVRHIGSPIKLTGTPTSMRMLGRPSGADSDAVLGGLGFDTAALAAMRAAGALG